HYRSGRRYRGLVPPLRGGAGSTVNQSCAPLHRVWWCGGASPGKGEYMRRWVPFGVAIVATLLTSSAVARAETCSPAMCAGTSPVCWLAYEKVMVNKESKFATVAQCKAVAQDLGGRGGRLGGRG